MYRLILVCVVFIVLRQQGFTLDSGKNSQKRQYLKSESYINKFITEALRLKLYEKKRWLLLGHYFPAIFYKYKSDADDKNFFLAARGKYDPKEEMIATIRAFFQKEIKQNYHPICIFPARFSWLNKYLNFDSGIWKDIKCYQFEDWMRRVKPKSISLVFSAYYMNNPASMFGHTLLKLNRKSREDKLGLVDYGFNYTAMPFSYNPIIYVLAGVTGNFQGFYSMHDYYSKVREYNDNENRDLWEYELNLTHEELDLVTRHLWELGSINFYYYYFDENCSYGLLKLIELARPEADFSRRFYFTKPSDTVKVVLEQPNLFRSLVYRPSLKNAFHEKERVLSLKERETLRELLSQKEKESSDKLHLLNVESQKRVLDTGISYFQFLKEKRKSKLSNEEKEKFTYLLLTRSKIQGSSDFSGITRSKLATDPVLGHETNQIMLSYRNNLDQDAALITITPALREIVDNPRGYAPYSQMIMMSFTLHTETNREQFERFESVSTTLEEFHFVDIKSFAPIDYYFQPISWNVDLGIRSLQAENSKVALKEREGYLTGGSGISASWDIGGLVYDAFMYTFVNTQMAYSKSFENSFRIGPGVQPGLIIRFFPWLNTNLSYEYYYFFFTDDFRERSSLVSETILSFSRFFALKFTYKYYFRQEDQYFQAGAKLYF